MTELTELHLAPPVAAVLELFGYGADDPAVREQAPTAARGHNLALAWPPAARYAAPALAGLVSAVAADSSRALVLVPPHAISEWAAVLFPLAEAAGLSALAAETPARATRRLREGKVALLLTSPAVALALLERSALKCEQVGHVVLGWPELCGDDEALAALMQDLPAEAQRLLVLAEPKPGHPLVERYARRALFTGPLSSEPPVGPPARVVTVAWSQRAEALAALLETDDPSSVTIWCADRLSVEAVHPLLPTGDDSIRVVTGEPPQASLVVAWDLPAPDRLAQLSAAGGLVLLVPPHASAYVRRVTSRQTPVRLPGSLEHARNLAAARRQAISEELARGGLDGELLALAPLLERFDPAAIAAALYRLWQAVPIAAPAPRPEEPAAATAPGRLWVGVGRKDGATPADLVAVLAREAGVPAAKIGRIELREMFSLVEVPAGEAEQIARRLTGKIVRRRTVTAKVDRGGPTRR